MGSCIQGKGRHAVTLGDLCSSEQHFWLSLFNQCAAPVCATNRFSAHPGTSVKEAHRSEAGTSDKAVPPGLQFKLKLNYRTNCFSSPLVF